MSLLGGLKTILGVGVPQARAPEPAVVPPLQRNTLSRQAPGDLSPRQLRGAYRSLVQMLIAFRARNFAPHMGRVRVQRRADQQSYEDVEDDHPWVELITRPTPHMPRGLFWQWVFQNIDAAGHADLLVEHRGALGRRVPAALHPVYPEYGSIHPAYGPQGQLEGWTYRMADGRWAELLAHDVVRVKAIHPAAPWLTAGKIEAAAYEIDALTAQNIYARDMARDQGKPKVALIAEKEIGRAKAIRLGRQFARMYRAGGSDMVPVSGGGMDIEQLLLNPKDMEFLAQTQATMERIFTIFETPIQLFSGEAYATGQNSARRGWHENTVQPAVDDATEQLEFELERIFEVQEVGTLRLRAPNAVPTDRKEEAEIAGLQLRTGKPLNRVLEDMGEEPVDGGDVSLVPGTLRPLGEVAAGF